MSFIVSSLGDYEQHEKNGLNDIVDNTCNGKCSECGECCGHKLIMSESEIKRIKAYIKTHNIKKAANFFPTRTKCLMLVCPFCDLTKRTHKCNIYEVRPDICRYFMCNNPAKAYMELARNNKKETYRIVLVENEFFLDRGERISMRKVTIYYSNGQKITINKVEKTFMESNGLWVSIYSFPQSGYKKREIFPTAGISKIEEIGEESEVPRFNI